MVGDIVLHPGQHIGKGWEGLCRVGVGRHAVLPAKAVVGLLQQAAERLRDGVLCTGGSRQRQRNGGGVVLYERTVFRAQRIDAQQWAIGTGGIDHKRRDLPQQSVVLLLGRFQHHEGGLLPGPQVHQQVLHQRGLAGAAGSEHRRVAQQRRERDRCRCAAAQHAARRDACRRDGAHHREQLPATLVLHRVLHIEPRAGAGGRHAEGCRRFGALKACHIDCGGGAVGQAYRCAGDGKAGLRIAEIPLQVKAADRLKARLLFPPGKACADDAGKLQIVGAAVRTKADHRLHKAGAAGLFQQRDLLLQCIQRRRHILHRHLHRAAGSAAAHPGERLAGFKLPGKAAVIFQQGLNVGICCGQGNAGRITVVQPCRSQRFDHAISGKGAQEQPRTAVAAAEPGRLRLGLALWQKRLEQCRIVDAAAVEGGCTAVIRAEHERRGGTALVGGTQPPRRSLLQQGLACFGRAAHAEAAQLRPAGDSGEKCACVYLYGIGLGQAAVLLEGKDLVGQRHGAAQFSAVGIHGLPPSSAVREDALE